VRILGLSSFSHNTAAALLTDKGIAAAFEESKLVRARTAGGIPREAIQYALGQVGIGWADLDRVVVAERPLRALARQVWLRSRRLPFAPVSSVYYQLRALGDAGRELNNDRILRLMSGNSKARMFHVEHHLCHAASAFYASPAERALILTLDEQGDGWAGAVAVGEGTRLRLLDSIPFPHSPAWIFSQITDLIGFQAHQDEHKTQWLGVGGDPVFEKLFLEMFRPHPGDLPRLSPKYFNPSLAGKLAFSPQFYRAIGVDPVDLKGAISTAPRLPLPELLRRQLAASVQQACAVLATEIAERYRKQLDATELCLAGGLFLNPVVVAAVERNTGFHRVTVQPAAGNEGTALGAAWYVSHHMQGGARQAPIDHLYWGPNYSNQDIKAILDNCKVRYRFFNGEEEKIEETLRLLDAGKIVAWYQGAAEFGPRALGNRSLLASPWAAYVRENLNDYVKHREAFRPFGISVLAERAAEFFDASPSARFMATLGVAKPPASDLLKGFLLPGDRVRLHLVERAANPVLWHLLEHFARRNPAPMLVNASFNLFGEPLVVSPRDAIRSYFCSGIDALVIGSFLLTK
jgi:carbamoyltransferase